MREAKIICPLKSARAGDAAHALEALQRQACKLFGGCTATQGQGQWIDAEGKLIAEPVTIVTIACDDNTATRAAIVDLACAVGKAATQDCVYTVLPNGEALIVPTRELWDKPALPAGVVALRLDNPARVHAAIRDAVGE